MSKVRHEYFCKFSPEYEKHIEKHKATTVRASKSFEVLQKQSKYAKHKRQLFLKQNPDEAIKEFSLTCQKCGKTFVRSLKIRNFKNNYKVPQYCCQKCANSHVYNAEERKKIAKSVSKLHMHKCPKCGKEFMHKGTNITTTFCDSCRPTKPIQQYDENGKKIVSLKTRQLLSKKAKERVKNGIHVGWKTRPIESYPEKFWKHVLINNNIDFEFNFYIQKKELGLANLAGYFLDFKLQNKIDLEIDGKQHKYKDREESDIVRDNALISNGWKVYRIDWNEINTDVGKKLMKQKIDDFLQWYQLNK